MTFDINFDQINKFAKTQEEEGMDDKEDNSRFEIVLQEGMQKEKLKKLKALLRANIGEQECQIIIKNKNGTWSRIKVPFKVRKDEKLETAINNIVNNS